MFASCPSPYVAGCTLEYDAEGHPSLDGQQISRHPPGTPREARLADLRKFLMAALRTGR